VRSFSPPNSPPKRVGRPICQASSSTIRSLSALSRATPSFTSRMRSSSVRAAQAGCAAFARATTEAAASGESGGRSA